GGPGEDLGAALFALDVDKAGKAMGGAAGEADRLGDALHDNAASKITAFRNSMQQNVVDFLGGKVIPAFLDLRDVAGRALGGMWAEAVANADSGALVERLTA
ncbi:hypothetical protein NGM37_06770, partial [Streptomyces sp. TRM76130]|nr:hypothetical protein [Streptomyces sp. TRM76130]